MRMLTTLTGRPAACFTTVFTIAPESDSSCMAQSTAYAASVRSSSMVSTTSSDRAVDRAPDLVAEAEPHLLDPRGLAGHDDHLAGPRAERLHEAQHRLRVHAVRVDHLAVLDAGLDLLLGRLHHVERAGLAALAAHVDQDERVVAAHHLVGEVEPAGPEVEHRGALGQLARLEPLHHLAAEAVVLSQALPMPATRIRFIAPPPPRGEEPEKAARSRA